MEANSHARSQQEINTYALTCSFRDRLLERGGCLGVAEVAAVVVVEVDMVLGTEALDMLWGWGGGENWCWLGGG